MTLPSTLHVQGLTGRPKISHFVLSVPAGSLHPGLQALVAGRVRRSHKNMIICRTHRGSCDAGRLAERSGGGIHIHRTQRVPRRSQDTAPAEVPHRTHLLRKELIESTVSANTSFETRVKKALRDVYGFNASFKSIETKISLFRI